MRDYKGEKIKFIHVIDPDKLSMWLIYVQIFMLFVYVYLDVITY